MTRFTPERDDHLANVITGSDRASWRDDPAFTVADRILASDWLRAVKADTWDEGVRMALPAGGIYVDGLLAHNPYRAEGA